MNIVKTRSELLLGKTIFDMNLNVNRENVGVGKLITWAFHYGSRHPYFGRITRVTNSTVWIEELPSIVVSCDGYGQNGTCIADTNASPKPHKKGLYTVFPFL